ncbi:DNA methyltransferase [Gulosibacter faecalis]|uniref:DNA methyltransferase n=1 Tax=Gulosibacter faecalis TaxID=272240 RepID=A0ABW5V1P2_9MICO|nr:site-specific DNA-methyltransferase [Gulosibacter faecalis]
MSASLLRDLPDLLAAAEADAHTALDAARARLGGVSLPGASLPGASLPGAGLAGADAPLVPHTHAVPGRLVFGDNVRALAELVAAAELEHAAGGAARPRLVYLDPPFDSKADYRSRVVTRLSDGQQVALEHLAYSDRWGGGTPEYLRMLATRLVLVRALLAPDGAVCVHVDWHASHWVRVMLDELFGAEHFVNNLVWGYRSGGASRTKSVPRKHDDLLLYRRSRAFRIRPLAERQYLRRSFMGSKVDAEGRHYADTLLRDVLEGAVHLVDADGGVCELSVRPVLNVSQERSGYATQKPLGLLELLLRWTTGPGDLVVDAFGGSGTTALAAAALGRDWVSIDSNPQAIATAQARLDAAGADYVVGRDTAQDAVGELRLSVESGVVRMREFTPAADAFGRLRPARGVDDGALAAVHADALAPLFGWTLLHREVRLASAWRDVRGQLDPELQLPPGTESTEGLSVSVTDLAGNVAVRPLATRSA